LPDVVYSGSESISALVHALFSHKFPGRTLLGSS
jgi:hypothetical protein